MFSFLRILKCKPKVVRMFEEISSREGNGEKENSAIMSAKRVQSPRGTRTG